MADASTGHPTESPASLPSPAPASPNRTRTTALIVACALFMQNLDSTVIATALPTMARAFGAEPVHMNVALTSYLLALAVFIPASGWVADRYGAKSVFRWAIVVFTVGSVLCGAADTLGQLVAARVFQGIGGAMMVPVGRLVLLRSVPKSELVAAMAWLSTPALIGPVLGPPLGGFMVTYFSWRAIFDINIPIGLLGFVLVTLYVQDVREPVSSRFDWIGLLLSGTGLASLMFGLETLGRGVVAPATSIVALATGLLAGLLYAIHARRHAAPLLDFTLLRHRTFLISCAAGTLFRIGVGAIPFLLPMMLQLSFGKSAIESGMITFASSLGALAMKPAATAALRRMGFRTTLIWNTGLSSILLGAVALFRPSWPLAALYAVLITGGFFRSLQFTAFNALAYAEIPRQQMSAATSLYATIQQVSLTLGVFAGAASLTLTMAAGNHATPMVSDFSTAFLVVAGIAILAMPLCLLMPQTAGTELSSHRRG